VIVDNVIDNIKRNRSDKLEGRVRAVPYALPKLNARLPIFSKGLYTIITSNSGQGKSTLINFMVFSAIKNSIDKNIPFKVMYFLLEDNYEKLILNLMSYLLYLDSGQRIGYLELTSLSDKTLPQDILNKIDSLKPLLNQYVERLIIHDNILNPTGIYNTVKKYAIENNHVRVVKKEIAGEIRDVFEKIDNPEIVSVIVDHVSLITLEQGLTTLRDSMTRLSQYFKQYITTKFDMGCIIIQQQAADNEDITHIKEKKLVPSLAGLADNKALQRDARLILALYNPSRYEIRVDNGYDISLLQNYYRSVHVLKNSHGESNVNCPVFFDGKVSFISELPPVKDVEKIQKVYKHIRNIENE
jgi:replicative DNA helicase